MILAAVALAVASDVGILPVAGDGSVDERHRAQIADGIKDVLKNRAVSLGVACEPTDARCLERAVGSNKDIDEVAAAWIGKSKDGSAHMTLTVLSVPDFKVALSVERNIEQGQEGYAVQELCVQAFDPGHWTGRVTIDGVPKGRPFLVDGLPAAETHLTLTVGDHELEVPRDASSSGPPSVTAFHVDYDVDKLVVASTAAAPGAAQHAGLGPIAPAVVAGVGVGAAVTAFLIDVFNVTPAITSWNNGANDPLVFLDKDADPASSGWGQEAYGEPGSHGLPSEAARFTMVAVAVKNERTSIAIDGVTKTVIGAGVAVAVGAGACAAVALLAAPE